MGGYGRAGSELGVSKSGGSSAASARAFSTDSKGMSWPPCLSCSGICVGESFRFFVEDAVVNRAAFAALCSLWMRSVAENKVEDS
jgi:hypothetical protein